jgi:hypothetical protein
MWTLVDVVDQVIHDESFGSLDSPILVLPSFACSNIYDSPPLSLDSGTHGDLGQCIQVDLDIFVFYSLRTDYCMNMEV